MRSNHEFLKRHLPVKRNIGLCRHIFEVSRNFWRENETLDNGQRAQTAEKLDVVVAEASLCMYVCMCVCMYVCRPLIMVKERRRPKSSMSS